MKNNANPFKKIAIFSVAVCLTSLFILSIPTAAKKPWNGIVHAPLKTARSFDWSAPDEFFDTAGTLKTFALDSSYHVLWTPQSGRPAPGDVVMSAGDYVAYFALTENISWWRGVFLSENPLEFTIIP